MHSDTGRSYSGSWGSPVYKYPPRFYQHKAFTIVTFSYKYKTRANRSENALIIIVVIGSKRDENGEWRRLHNEKLIVSTVHLI